MSRRRDATRTLHARWWMMSIAFALACGRTDAPAATGHEATTMQPHTPVGVVAVDTTLPAGPMGDAVRRGRALLAATRDSLPSHVGSTLRCFSCHLDEGRRGGTLSLTRAYAHYPQYRARSAQVELIESRINDCFVRSLNGRALNNDGTEMRDIIAYLSWLGRSAGATDAAAEHDAELAPLDADTARGAAVFAAKCTRCHGKTGQGIGVVPPLWGPKSFNIGAGMARYRTAAPFVLHNMPFDMPNTLTPQQALDVARYIDSQPRPDLAGKENDWPKGNAPPDVPYHTRAGAAGVHTARDRAPNGAR